MTEYLVSWVSTTWNSKIFKDYEMAVRFYNQMIASEVTGVRIWSTFDPV